MKRVSFLLQAGLILAGVFFSVASSYGQELSPQAEISLLTCSPGGELYSQFGHSALRVRDPENILDIVFNYGTFDFNTPNFYMKFAKGKLNYMLSCGSFYQFKREYAYENRGIVEQKLNLDHASKQRLFNALQENYKPENKFYKYDFLFDNCSTRIRDIVEDNLCAPIQFSSRFKEPKNFWNLLDPYIEKSRWSFLGIHLALGMPCDVAANTHQYMFLPDNLMYGFEKAYYKKNGVSMPLVQSTRAILVDRTNFVTTKWYKRPWFIFGLVAIAGLAASIYCFRKERDFFLFDVVVFGLSGLLGWLIVFLWFATDHQATGPNLNILWASPLHIPFVFSLFKNKKRLAYFYFLFNTIILLVVLAFWSVIPQSLPNQVLPFVALLFVRSLYITKKLKNQFINGYA